MQFASYTATPHGVLQSFSKCKSRVNCSCFCTQTPFGWLHVTTQSCLAVKAQCTWATHRLEYKLFLADVGGFWKRLQVSNHDCNSGFLKSKSSIFHCFLHDHTIGILNPRRNSESSCLISGIFLLISRFSCTATRSTWQPTTQLRPSLLPAMSRYPSCGNTRHSPTTPSKPRICSSNS